MIRALIVTVALAGLSGCGIAYNSPSVNPVRDGETKVRVVSITPESVLAANRTAYRPKELPAVFFQTAGYGSGTR